jgi:hypothetical protein
MTWKEMPTIEKKTEIATITPGNMQNHAKTTQKATVLRNAKGKIRNWVSTQQGIIKWEREIKHKTLSKELEQLSLPHKMARAQREQEDTIPNLKKRFFLHAYER